MKAAHVVVSAVLLAMTSFGAIPAEEPQTQNIVITYSGDLQPEVLSHKTRHDYAEDYEDYYDDDKKFRRLLRKHKKLNLKELEKNVEEACLALTLGQVLGFPRAELTLFVRNEGVALANKQVVSAISKLQDNGIIPECQFPDSNSPTGFRFGSLQENLEQFGEANILNCPICWCARFPETTECGTGGQTSYDTLGYGTLPTTDPTLIPEAFLTANKVIDF